MVCDNVACGKIARVEEGVAEMVCNQDVCERWWVTKMCVKDGV